MYGERLKQFRITTGLTQAEFAKRYNISQKNVSDYENDREMPDKLKLVLLSQDGLNLNWLVGGVGSMKLKTSSESAFSLSEQPVKYGEGDLSSIKGLLDINSLDDAKELKRILDILAEYILNRQLHKIRVK